MDGYVPISNGYLLFSVLSRQLGAMDSSRILHEDRRSVCCSALLPEYFWQTFSCSSSEGKLYFKKKDVFAFRISFLDDNQYFIFKKAVQGYFLQLGGARFCVFNVSAPGENQMSRSQSVADLYHLPAVDSLRVQFISPTGFKSDEQQRSLPIPQLFFQSLALKWAESQEDLMPKVSFDSIAISDFSLKSCAVRLKNDLVFRGCTGFIRYEFLDMKEEAKQVLTRLASFSFFCGAGYKTSQGLGQVLVQLGKQEGEKRQSCIT